MTIEPWDGKNYAFPKFDSCIDSWARSVWGDALGQELWNDEFPTDDELEEMYRTTGDDDDAWNNYCKRIYRHFLQTDFKEAKIMFDSDEFWELEFQQDWIVRQYASIMLRIEEASFGQAKTTVRNLDKKDARKIRQILKKKFGKERSVIILSREHHYAQAMPPTDKMGRPIGLAFTARTNMPDKLQQLENEKTELYDMCPASVRSGYRYGQDIFLSRIVTENVHSSYHDTIRQRTTMYQLVDLKMDPEIQKQKLKELDAIKHHYNDDHLLPWEILKDALLDTYEINRKEWGDDGISPYDDDSKQQKFEKLPTMNISTTEQRCFSCGEVGHRRGDSMCNADKNDVHASAPDWVKRAHNKRKRGGDAEGASSSSGKQECRFFAKNGRCKFGSDCKFAHRGKSNGTQRDWSSKKERKRITSMVAKQLTAEFRREQKRQKTDDSGSKKGTDDNVKGLYSLIAGTTALAVSCADFRERESNDASGDRGIATQVANLQANLLDVDRCIGIDTDSGRSMSTERQDFISLDTSAKARNSVSVNGAGGGLNTIGGIGTMVVYTKNTQGATRCIIDTDAVYVEADAKQPKFRVLGQMRMRKKGLVLRQCHDDTETDVLLCRRTKETIPLEEQNQILVLETQAAPRQYCQTDALHETAMAVQRDERSPLVPCAVAGLVSRGGGQKRLTAIAAVLLFTTITTMAVTSLVMNEGKLDDDEKALLWHWRWGHPDWQAPITASRGMNEHDALANVKPNIDCPICDKAKHKNGSYGRNDPYRHEDEPPFWVVHVDGYGGGTNQSGSTATSMGGPSFEGAVGGFVFYCRSSKTLRNKLYASSEQFPIALFQFLQQVESEHYTCREIKVDTYSVNLSTEAEDVAALFRTKITPISAGTPQENAFAESGVRVIAEVSRALMLGAPHLPSNMWALADNYACWIRDVKPQRNLRGKSSFEIRHGRKPPHRELFIKIFGAPCNFAPIDGAVHKRAELTEDGWFVGVQWPMVLVLRKSDMKVINVSRKKCKVYEGHYVKKTPDEIMDNGITEITNSDNLECVKSAKSLRAHNLNRALVEPVHSTTSEIQQAAIDTDITDPGEGVHIPEHMNYDLDTFMQHLTAIQREALNKTQPVALRDKIYNGIKDIKNAVLNNVKNPGELSKGKTKSTAGIDKSNIMDGQRSGRGARKPDSTDETVVAVPPKRKPLTEMSRMVGATTRKLIKGDVVSIDNKMFDGDDPGSYSLGQPPRSNGVVKSTRKDGVVKVLWEGSDKTMESHWKHLTLEIPKTSVEIMLSILADGAELKSKPSDQYGDWPKNFFEALIRSDWRDWVAAVKKECNGWTDNGTTKLVRYEDMKSGSRCIPLGELFSIKRDGRYKFRQIAFGNLLRPGKDYGETFSSTVSADGMRWFFAIACSTGMQIFGWDATTGYLQSVLKIPVYAYLPSHYKYSELSYEELAVFREQLLKLTKDEGKDGLRRFIAEHRKNTRKNPEEVLELVKSVYGIPSAGNNFAMLMRSTHVEKCNMTQTETDPSIYIRFETDNSGAKDNGHDGKVLEFLFVIVWTDDVRYFGTDKLRLQYERDIKANMKVEFEGPSETFVSCDFKQDFRNGTLEVTQSKYWDKVVEGNKHLWKDGIPTDRKIPLSPSDATYLLQPVSDEDFEDAKNLQFPQLLGQIQYPTVYTKLEMRFAISLISRQRNKWTKKSFGILVKALEYGYATRHMGLMYSCGLDKHGTDVIYAYADSNFAAPRSQGCRILMMNGCAITFVSQRHTTTDTSTCEAEATEFFLATREVSRFRNLMGEIGMYPQTATTVYQDNQPAIQVMKTRGSLPNKSKAMDIRVLSARNKVEDEQVAPVYIDTTKMLADIGTKALDEKQFVQLRDDMNGYSLVKLKYPDMEFPRVPKSE